MATSYKAPPVSSQQSTSGLSEPPDTNYDAVDEIVVNVPTTTLHSQDSPSNNKMAPRTRRSLNQQSQGQQRPKRNVRSKMLSISGDELAMEIEVAPSISNSRVAAKRSQLDNPTKANGANPPTKKLKVTSRSKKWDPDYVTQSTRSPLAKADLRALLLQPAAWDCLTAEDKREILGLFPDDTHILGAGTPDARPNLESLKNDDNFRHDAEQYLSNLGKGMHDLTWLKDAWTAHHRRAAGDFDAYYIRKLEIDWNTTIPDEYKPEHLRSEKNGKSCSPVGHSVQGDVVTGEKLDAPVVAPTTSGVAWTRALPPAEDAMVETTPPKASNGTCDASEIVAVSTDDSCIGTGSSLTGKIKGEVSENASSIKTNGNGVALNGTAHIAAEGTNGGTEKASGSNEAKPLAVSGDADVPRDSMDVAEPEAPSQSA